MTSVSTTPAIPVTAFLPEALVLCAALLVFLLDALGVRRRAYVGGLVALLLGGSFLSLLADVVRGPLAGLATVPANLVDVSSPGPVIFSSFGLIFALIFVGAGLLVTLGSLSEAEDDPGVPVFYGLLALATLGMLLVTLAADLIFLLLAVEITGISTYVLVGYSRKDARALEASMKFYIIGALSTAISFFGASLVFGAYGTTRLSALQDLPPTAAGGSLAVVGLGLIMVGLGFKLTLVPFHMWAVDVYDGAPDSVSAFLAAGSKKMGLFAFLAIFVAVARTFASAPVSISPSLDYTIFPALGGLAVVTMTVGNILALQQPTMKRMLAYSSISQAGYLLLGVAVGTPAALAGAGLLAVAHVLMKGGAFLVVAAAGAAGIGSQIADYKGFGSKYPVTGAAFAILLLSLAGIPLTLGFVGKFYLFAAAVEANGLFILLAIAGLLNSAVSVFYYARVLRTMYTTEGPEPPAAASHGSLAHAQRGVGNAPPGTGPSFAARVRAEIAVVGRARWLVILGCAVLTLVLGIYPTPLVNALNAAAEHFYTLGV